MPRIPPRVIQSYIFGGRIRSKSCMRAKNYLRRVHPDTTSCLRPIHTISTHNLHLDPGTNDTDEPYIPLRKQIKDEIKRRKAVARDPSSKNPNASAESLPDWELTVGIEIHAQLNTTTKLFSHAPASPPESPNSQLALFDLAIPGSLPVFQPATLIPALRAALALNCTIHRTSTFDRKHYFHWDQPAGYQLTQFYRPFATDGHITLYPHDGIAPEDGDSVTIGIKQIQMEQDTAKTITDDDTDTHLIDYSRVGLPLIEIITHPHLHHPSTAAALVRKIQTLLHSVDACVLGMDRGGLRADVNVSVRPRPPSSSTEEPLGQRTEIKNLSSHKSIRDAILAERTRQIAVLSSGGTVVGETRGFSIGGTETRRLRAKEGEVDYRYMPDADVPPVIIGEDLIHHLHETLGVLPDAEIEDLTTKYGLSSKDAISLTSLDGGARVEYFYDVVDELRFLSPDAAENVSSDVEPLGKVAANWVLHELGALAASRDAETPLFDSDGNCAVPAKKLARIIHYVNGGRITGLSGKSLLAQLAQLAQLSQDPDLSPSPSPPSVDQLIEDQGLWFKGLSDEEYKSLALRTREERIINEILKKGEEKAKGKIMYWVGRMVREGGGEVVDGKVAEGWVRRLVEEERRMRDGK